MPSIDNSASRPFFGAPINESDTPCAYSAAGSPRSANRDNNSAISIEPTVIRKYTSINEQISGSRRSQPLTRQRAKITRPENSNQSRKEQSKTRQSHPLESGIKNSTKHEAWEANGGVAINVIDKHSTGIK
ncbi:MAG: hypothetical protein ACI8Z1_000616 [Candidatus Azotimanducaceae bacterium]|jgi:hypothetical protein